MNGFIALHSLKEENAKGKNKTTTKIKREAIKHLIRVEKCSPPAYILRGIWVSKKNNADGKNQKERLKAKKYSTRVNYRINLLYHIHIFHDFRKIQFLSI